jgi:hypothetical protein
MLHMYQLLPLPYWSLFQIVRDPNARKIKEKTAVNEMLKMDAGEVTYEKYEPLTLEAYHANRRRWLMKFEDQATFDDWAKMLTKCTKMCKSGLLKEPVAIAAFDSAFLETKRCCWPWTYNEYGGTESDQLIGLVRCYSILLPLFSLFFPSLYCLLPWSTVYGTLSPPVPLVSRLSWHWCYEEDGVQQGSDRCAHNSQRNRRSWMESCPNRLRNKPYACLGDAQERVSGC